MPVLTKYDIIIDSGFPNKRVNSNKLTREIADSSIVIALNHIETTPETCSVWFKDVLSQNDEITLTTIASYHDGIDDVPAPSLVKIKEESGDTGGNFSIYPVSILAEANSSTTVNMIWPFPITALEIKVGIDESQKNDTLDVMVAPDTVIGIITSSSSSNPPAWTSQNYVVGDKVTFSNQFGERVYSCILNTTSNQNPSNSSFWKHGFELTVNSTVTQNCEVGYYIKISNGVDVNDLGRVISKTTSKIYMEKSPLMNFNPGAYILQTIYSLKDYPLGMTSFHRIGEGKIGGSYVPANVIIGVRYKNNNGIMSQTLKGAIELLY